jgi:Lar family restriction alleviation protein
MTLSRQQIEEIALLPCPFCGGEAVVERRDVEPQGDPWYGRKMEIIVICGTCAATLFDQCFHEGFTDNAAAIAAWNSRAALALQALDAGQPVAWQWSRQTERGTEWVVVHDKAMADACQQLFDNKGTGQKVQPLYPSPSVPADKGEPRELDGAELFEIFFNVTKDGVPEELSDDDFEEAAKAINRAFPRAPAPASSVEALRDADTIAQLVKERDEAVEWRDAIRSLCKALDTDDLPWGGDKDGWGFQHYFIKHLHTRAEAAEAEAATLREALERETEHCALIAEMHDHQGIIAAAIRARTQQHGAKE